MPWQAPHPCNKCRTTLTNSRYCEPCFTLVRARDNAKRGSSVKFYKTKHWRFVRERHLVEHPWCEQDMGNGTICGAYAHLEVDHIKPRGCAAHVYEHTNNLACPVCDADENLQTLCKSHHASKTASEDGGFGRRKK